MKRFFCRVKISNAIVTKTNVEYEGSLGVDRTILEAANIAPFEMALVANTTNGARFETYIIEEKERGTVALYGGAARLGKSGDKLIIIVQALLEGDEIKTFKSPKVIILKEGNKL